MIKKKNHRVKVREEEGMLVEGVRTCHCIIGKGVK
jgi:hypothetical protein